MQRLLSLIVLVFLGGCLPDISQEDTDCFYCGKWDAISRVFWVADTLLIDKESVTWAPCGPTPVAYSVVSRSQGKAVIRFAPQATCELHGEKVLYVRFEIREISKALIRPGNPSTPGLALSLFPTEQQYKVDDFGTWGVYERLK
jgi:hypothetical protein